MSTEDHSPEPPRTRAEARAAREAAEREAAEREAAAREAAERAATEESPRGALSEERSDETKRVERAPASRNPESTPPEIPRAPEGERLRLPPVAQPVSSAAAAQPPLNDQHDAPDPKPPAPKNRRFLYTILAVVGVLVVVVAGLSVVSLFQGPRVSEVQVDAAEAIQVSGSRVILTANQSLQEIDESQVSVEPAAPFTIDAAGRNVGIRFTVPLDDAT
ncbi:MAG: hypothetical protein ACTH2E_10300, partial [Microbacterium sp.]